MGKSNNQTKELFRIIDEKFPFMGYRKEHGYLKLSEKQVILLNEMKFEPYKHMFAAVTETGSGIKFYTLNSDSDVALSKYIEKCEENPEHLPYLYLGKTDEIGRINYIS